jgi:hypothetical protein
MPSLPPMGVVQGVDQVIHRVDLKPWAAITGWAIAWSARIFFFGIAPFLLGRETTSRFPCPNAVKDAALYVIMLMPLLAWLMTPMPKRVKAFWSVPVIFWGAVLVAASSPLKILLACYGFKSISQPPSHLGRPLAADRWRSGLDSMTDLANR